MELSDYIRVLRRTWVLLIVAALVGGGGASLYAERQAPVYQADATVVVTLNSGGTIGDISTGASYLQQVVQTYADVATTPAVLTPVIARLKLNTTADELEKRVTVTASTSNTLLDISATDSSAQRAADIADAVGTQLTSVVKTITPSDGKTEPVKISSVREASAPTTPISPNVPLTLLIGVVGAMALVLVLAILRAALDKRIRRPQDVEAVTDSPVIGGIARSAVLKRHPLIVRHDPTGRLAEAFRSLRTNLQFLDIDHPAHTMVITSSTAGEGKTTTAVNLALALADAKADVLLIDADLRRSSVADNLLIDGTVGLTDVLIGRISIDDALQSWGDGEIVVLPAGTVPPNPSELLQSDAMSTLLDRLQQRFGTIVIDAPPLLPVSDAAILAHRVGSTIMVCATGSTSRDQLTDAIAKVDRVGGKVLGVVMTKLPVRGADASPYASYEYKAQPDGRGRRAAKAARGHAAAHPRGLNPVQGSLGADAGLGR